MIYYVYILASIGRRSYVGITNHLSRRVWEHRNGVGSAFAMRYRINRLVHYEQYESVHIAISREKQIKSWTRERKLRLIEESNPTWRDLGDDFNAPSDEPLSKRRIDSSLRSE